MQTDPNSPPSNDPKSDNVPPPPVIGGPPLLSATSAPTPADSQRKSASWQHGFAILLSIGLGLFLADGLISLLDDSLILFFGVHGLSVLRGLVFLLTALTALVIYVLMGLTPMIPKRLFLPLTLFIPAGELLLILFSIYAYDRIQQAVWGLSLCEVMLGLGLLYWAQGGFKFRWPLVPEKQMGGRGFSWRNLAGFLLANVFLLAPAVIVYLLVCASLAVNHFTDGFMSLRPGGLTVQVRKYARNDGKTIELFPMAHVADAAFYQKVSQSFPTNSIILMEGVTDEKNLLTNKISYKRMARALGLHEQHEDFKPSRGEMVRADVDIDQFATNTIDLLNLAMLIHAKGVTVETLLKLMQSSQPPGVQDQLIDDLVRKRNRHLLDEIQTRLSQSKNIIVPWGAAHMPGLAKEIQKSGFHLDQSKEYVVIRF